MSLFPADLQRAIRDRFAHVDTCPFTGPRVFFENAGGALTLKSVVETSTKFAAIPDNQGRDNPASHALVDIIAKARADTLRWLGADQGCIFVGESGTEVIFRMVRDACLGTDPGTVLGSTLEHPATRSAATRWAAQAGKDYVSIAHSAETGTVTAADYAAHVTPQTRVATVIHTSPVSGMGTDLGAISAAIRAVSPDCLIIADGIQHAAHGGIDIASYQIDGYAISPYKVFSRHGYGIGWMSERLSALPHDTLLDGPGNWELGTRDTGAYATFSDVTDYFEWLGAQVSDSSDPRVRIEAASRAIKAHEHALTEAMLHGIGNHAGLAGRKGVHILGGVDNPAREGLVALWSDEMPSADLVAGLNARGIRAHVRKADHYSGTVLRPLGLETCVRVSLCHYNTADEVAQFLDAMDDMGLQ